MQMQMGQMPPRTERARWDVLLAVALGAAAFALFLTFLRDPLGHDDRRIFIFAQRFLHGLRGEGYAETHFRLGFILEHALAQLIFGYNSTAYYAVAFVNNALAVCSVFFLCRVFFPRLPSVLCAVLFMTNPYFLAQSSWPQVDWPATWRFFFGLALTVIAVRRSELPARGRYLAAVGGAFFLWWSFYTKLSVAPLLLCVPGLIFIVTFDKISWKSVVGMAFVFAAFLGLGFYLNDQMLGDPMARINRVREAQTFAYSQKVFLAKGIIPLDLTWWDLLLRYPELYWSLTPGKLLVGLTLVSGVVALATRRRPLILFLGLALAYWGLISLKVNSTDPLIPALRTKDRYFSASFGLLTVLCCGALYTIVSGLWVRTGSRWRRGGLGTLVALAVGGLAAYQVDFHRRHPIGYHVANLESWGDQGACRATSRFAREGADGIEVTRVLSDTRNIELLRMFMPVSHRDKLKTFDTGSRWKMPSIEDFKRGDLVYLHFGRLASNQRKYYKDQIPDFIQDRPPHWKKVWSARKQGIYIVTETVRSRPVAAVGGPLVKLLHAYSQVRDDPAEIERIEAANSVRFEIRNGTDVRIATNPKSYTRRPQRGGAAEVLWIDRAMNLVIGLDARLEGELILDGAYLIPFTRGQKRPSMLKCSETKLADGRVRIARTLSVDPQKGHEAFNILLKIKGSGSITLTDFSVSELAYDAHTANKSESGYERIDPFVLADNLEEVLRDPAMADMAYWRSKSPLPATFAYPIAPTLSGAERANVTRLKNGEFTPYKLFDWRPLGVPPPWDANPFDNNTFDYYRHALVWTEQLVDAWVCERDAESLALLKRVIEDWLRSNGKPPGASKYAWNDQATSYRLRLMCWMWELLRRDESFDDAFARLLLAAIYQHALYATDVRRFNPASNHALHLQGSLLAAAITLPEFQDSQRWRALALDRLIRFMQSNFSPEGFHLEQSPSYHWYVLEKTGEIVAFLRANGEPLPDSLLVEMRKAVRAWPYLIRPDGTHPNVGDTGKYAPKNWRDRLRKLFGVDLSSGDKLAARSTPRDGAGEFELSFRAGYAIFTSYALSDPNPQTDTYALFRCNSWHHTGHCHRDALSFVLFGLGRDWLVDSGKLNYEGDTPERQFMVSAHAHNVVLVDRKGFQYHPIELLEQGRTKNSDFVTVNHHLPEAIHVRRFEFVPPHKILLTDDLESTDGRPHRYAQLFHIAPGLDVDIAGERVRIQAEDGKHCMIVQSGDRGQWSRIEGQKEPFVQGWHSRHYNRMDPNTVLYYETPEPVLKTRFVTEIWLETD